MQFNAFKTINTLLIIMENDLLGAKLKYLRHSRGLTQKQLAKVLHMSVSTISALETGYRRAQRVDLSLFANFYGIDVIYLNNDSIPVIPSVNTNDLSVQEVALVNGFANYIRYLKRGIEQELENYRQTLLDPTVSIKYKPAEKFEEPPEDTQETSEDL